MTRRLEPFFTDQTRKRRILALDGGGVRGLLTLGVLDELEKELRRRSGNNDYRLSQYFDLIGGTSTGSIIATGLAFGWTVEKVWDAYNRIVPKIFGRTSGMGLFTPMYREKPLVDALTEFFGEETLESAELETGLAIFAKSMSSGSAWVFCNNPRWNYYDNVRPGANYAPNRAFMLRSLVQASAAAPHFFRGVLIRILSSEKKNKPVYFVDGGVGGFNNPALELLTVARDPAYGFNWKLGADDLYLMSIGTGWSREKSRDFLERLSDNIFFLQTVKALRGMINDVSLQQVAYLQAMSRTEMRWYINGEKQRQGNRAYLAAGDNPALHYQRIDVRFEPEHDENDKLLPDTAEAFLGRKLRGAEFKGLRQITNAKRQNSDLLSQLGRAAGARAVREAPPPALFDPNPWVRDGQIGPGARRS